MNIAEILASITVTLLPIGFMIPWTNYKCWDVGGVYVNGKVYVCEVDSNREFYTLHEKGHYIYFNVLTEKQKKDYKTIYDKHYKKGLKAFYREYSYKSMEESFADDFALWQGNKRVNIHTKQRIKLISSFF